MTHIIILQHLRFELPCRVHFGGSADLGPAAARSAIVFVFLRREGLCIIHLSIRGRLLRRMDMKAFKKDAAVTVATHASLIRQIIGIVRRLGPYAAIEIVLPGGSLVVLLLWLFRRRKYVQALTHVVRTWLLIAIEGLATVIRV